MIKPIDENITIIYEEIAETTTDSGIVVTGRAAEDRTKPAVAIVAGIGSKSTIGVEVGDVVLWDRISKGVHGNTHIVHESHIIAVVETE